MTWALILLAFTACLAVASDYSCARGFLKNWAIGVVVVLGLVAAGAALGHIMWVALYAP
jgi:hypothetical protein